ncbi:hypothetical protein [Staphylococcus saprophyticus]|uniref:hypothetical protein n=1 Tax=Staphylococcus saprophyticus TaxID=29385 RepID=UPI0002D6B057|nr:hypothetical protein [Staphylococcus saprophyticus]
MVEVIFLVVGLFLLVAGIGVLLQSYQNEKELKNNNKNFKKLKEDNTQDFGCGCSFLVIGIILIISIILYWIN